ncbi:hypothetical protein AVEN_143317-1 [Araneus ventricosus]|uniref:Uncharacterized protein n=1 Tax=Araneus ventricosus TaxID=182803 RepID=A0A4Y2AF94_ARAVE|nr:hypothetical protein AVEN_143317-1 [Araneus ventricosus]
MASSSFVSFEKALIHSSPQQTESTAFLRIHGKLASQQTRRGSECDVWTKRGGREKKETDPCQFFPYIVSVTMKLIPCFERRQIFHFASDQSGRRRTQRSAAFLLEPDAPGENYK